MVTISLSSFHLTNIETVILRKLSDKHEHLFLLVGALFIYIFNHEDRTGPVTSA